MLAEMERRKAAETAKPRPNVWEKTREQEVALESLDEMLGYFRDMKTDPAAYQLTQEDFDHVVAAEAAFKKNNFTAVKKVIEASDILSGPKGMLLGTLERHAVNDAAARGGKKEDPTVQQTSAPPSIRQRRAEQPPSSARKAGGEAITAKDPTTVIDTSKFQAKPSGIRGLLNKWFGPKQT